MIFTPVLFTSPVAKWGRQHQPSTSAKTEKVIKKTGYTERRARKAHKSKGKKKKSAKKSKSNGQKSLSGSGSSLAPDKKKLAEEQSKKLNDVDDTTDRLKDWISSLNVLSSKEFNAGQNEEAMPTDSLEYVCRSRLSCDSSVSRVEERHPRPLPVKEAETQTFVNQEEERRKRRLIEEKIYRRQEEFQRHFHILVERQYFQAAKIWRIGREMQQLTKEASVAIDLSDLSSSELTGNYTSYEQPSISVACGRDHFTGSNPNNGRHDSLDSSVTNAPNHMKALGWLEEELLHHECMEQDSRDVPRGIHSHTPCLYGNGFIQKRETRITTARVAFADDCSVNGRNSASVKGTLKKRLKWFRKSIKVRKKSPKLRQSSSLAMNDGLRRTCSGQYMILVLIVFAQFVAQLLYS
ncbi:hypothetical protein Btru_048218 [Bulinus truncatus]|nr:hypothetical protein Btru_048218 [Bulinus truncatus]